MSDTRETIRFSDNVSPGSSVSLTKTMREAGTVEKVDVRFYSGPDLTVEVEPYVAIGDEGDRERERLSSWSGSRRSSATATPSRSTPARASSAKTSSASTSRTTPTRSTTTAAATPTT